MDQKLETCWFAWPWNDLRNSAALACELVRKVVPTRAEIQVMPSEVVGDGPYRSTTFVEVKVPEAESTTEFEARCALNRVLEAIELYIAGEHTKIEIPAHIEPDRDFSTRLYWYARELGDDVKKAAAWAAQEIQPQRAWTDRGRAFTDEEKVDAEQASRWSFTGRLVQDVAEFLQKCATQSGAAGAPDGAGNAILARIARVLIDNLGVHHVEVGQHVLHWRFRDGLRGRVLDEEWATKLRLAFEAAWIAGEFKFGYGLLEPEPEPA